MSSGLLVGGGGTGIGPGWSTLKATLIATPRALAFVRAAWTIVSASPSRRRSYIARSRVFWAPSMNAAACFATSVADWPPSVRVSTSSTMSRLLAGFGRPQLRLVRALLRLVLGQRLRESTPPRQGCGGTSGSATATPKRSARTEPRAVIFIGP